MYVLLPEYDVKNQQQFEIIEKHQKVLFGHFILVTGNGICLKPQCKK